MRKRHALIVGLIALVAVSTLSVTGQEEPLPTVQPRPTSFVPDAASFQYVALAVEPARELPAPTLADAVRRNDYVTFNALYTSGKAAGENVRAFDALHELWSWSMNDPVGAFYGAGVHDRLARAYPGFAEFIDAYRIVDSRGAVYYPTSETRTFLLARALEGRAPRVLIAEAAEQSAPTTSSRSEVRPSGASVRSTTSATPAPARVAADATSNAAPIGVAAPPPSRESAVRQTPPTEVAVRTKQPQEIATAEPESTIAPVVPAIADAPLVREIPLANPSANAPAPVVAANDRTPIARENALANRGILLLVLGIIGIGLLAVMLRTPSDTTMPSIMQPPAAPPAEQAAEKSAESTPASVEPIHRANGQKRAS